VDRLLSPEQAAELLGCRRTYIFELLARGDLASVKLGRLRRIPASAVEKFIQARVAEGGKIGPD
jgi:excisionase family DNA binding protein